MPYFCKTKIISTTWLLSKEDIVIHYLNSGHCLKESKLIVRRCDFRFLALCHWKSSLLSGSQITNRICLISLQQRNDKTPLALLLLRRCWVAFKGWVQKFLWANFQLFDWLIGFGVLGFLKPRFERWWLQGWTLLHKDVTLHFSPKSRLCGAVNASSLLRCLHCHPALLLCYAFAHGILPTFS